MRHSSLLKVCPQRPLRVKCFTFQIHKPFYTHFLWYLTFSCSAKTTHLVKHIHLQIFSASIILVQNSPCKLNRYGIFLDFWCHYLQKRKTKIIMIQCWDYFMFLHRQLSKGRGAEWRILTSLPPYPGESLSGLHQTQRESKEPILNSAYRPSDCSLIKGCAIPYSKPTKQHKHTPQKKKMNWKATINSEP